MKKFFTVIPLQKKGKLDAYVYEPVGNLRLRYESETRFPIIPVIHGYVSEGEEFRVIAVMTDNDDCRYNLSLLENEIKDVCTATGALCTKGVETVVIKADERVSAHVETFQRLIDFADDNDELFICMTYGTKPTSTALMMAAQYAYRIKRNAIISCVVYGQIDRGAEKAVSRIYDMTALIQLDEIVRMLAERHIANPKEMIDRILSL